MLNSIFTTAQAEGSLVELIAPKVGGVTLSDGTLMAAKQKINGGPSVLYDAVIILTSDNGAALLSCEATAKDFISDAFAHAKVIGYVPSAKPLLDKAGAMADGGCIELKSPADLDSFMTAARELRFWAREVLVHAV